MPRKILNRDQQCYAVTRLACYAMPSQVRDEIRDEYGLVISPSALQHYDPTTYQGQDLAVELKELFHTTRAMYREQSATIAVGDKVYRLMQLQNLLERALHKDNIRLALAVMAQAARETGGCYQRKDYIEQASATLNLSLEQQAYRHRMVPRREHERATISAAETWPVHDEEEIKAEPIVEQADDAAVATTGAERIEPVVEEYRPQTAEDEKAQIVLRQYNDDLLRIYGAPWPRPWLNEQADEQDEKMPAAGAGNDEVLPNDETTAVPVEGSQENVRAERKESPAMIFLDPRAVKKRGEQSSFPARPYLFG